MKPFLEVDKNRQAYHQNAARNTVHRASLLAPKIPGAATWISFLNHFLIKRGYQEVACKLTALGASGQAIESASFPVDEPRVYSINLDQFFQAAPDASEYLIEFYSHKNLFIPFPAVMVNHVGEDFTNVVHSYNRVLNDIFENDAVNKHQVSEASIDVCVDDRYDTFFNFASGPFEPSGTIGISVSGETTDLMEEIPVHLARLTNKNFCLSDIFPGATIDPGAVIKISQPRQELFYGRLLSGIVDRKTGAFSANHSYYDSSNTREYFDNQLSQRVYPYFEGFLNHVTMYPVMSPGAISVHIRFFGGGLARRSDEKILRSPSGTPVSFDIDELVRELRIDDCTAFELVAAATGSENIPTRVMHQLNYGMQDSRSKLLSSIAIGLQNEKAFVPPYKTGLAWGQALCHPDYESRVGICFNGSSGAADTIEVDFYDQTGHLQKSSFLLSTGQSLILDPKSLALSEASGHFIWFVAKSRRADLSAQSFHAHVASHNASGEHSF
jgi:hypothetical protein